MEGGVRPTDPGTSHMAAKRVNVTKLEILYIATLKQLGHPLSTTEIGRICGHGRDSFSPRSKRLVEKRWIVEAGHRFCENFQGNWFWMKAYALPEWPVPAGGWPTRVEKPKGPKAARHAEAVAH